MTQRLYRLTESDNIPILYMFKMLAIMPTLYDYITKFAVGILRI